MSNIFSKSFLRKIKRSKTMMFNLLVGFIGILEYNLHLFYDLLGEYYGVVFVLVATINMGLRIVTTQSLDDKNDE